MARGTKLMKLILGIAMLIPFVYGFSEGKPSGRQIREETLRINALELEQIDITKVLSESELKEEVGLPEEMIVVLSDETLKFGFNKDNIESRYYGILRNLIDYVNTYDYNVIVIGHTDSKGSNEYNMKLGRRRAENTANLLMELGLTPDRLKGIESRGEEEPVATNDTEIGRSQNRRIEFNLIKR